MRFGHAIAIVLVSHLLLGSGAEAIPLFRGTPMVFDIGADVPGKLPMGEQSFGYVVDLNDDGRDDIVVENHRTTYSVSVLLGASASSLPSIFRPKANVVFDDPQFHRVAVGDFNDDGKPDLLASVDSTLWFFAGDGLGGFSQNHVDSNQTGNYFLLFPGDLNGDGTLDVFVAEGSGPFYGVALFGAGTGTFTAGPGMPINYQLRLLRDVTGDGKPDLLGWSSPNLMVGVGRGDGTFDPPIYSSVSVSCIVMETGDFDGDSIQDLAALDQCGTHVALLHGSGNGFFTEVSTISIPRIDADHIAVRDLDLDGHADLAVTFNHRDSLHPPGQGVNNLLVLFGDGTGHFPTQRWTNGGGNPSTVLTGDFDGNGLPDIATTSLFDPPFSYPTAHALNVLLNQGAREFGSGPDRAATYGPESEAVADVNRDGIPDLLVADNQASIEIHLGDGSGGFGATLTQALTPSNSISWFSMGDINRDGKVDLAATGVDLLLGNGDGTFGDGGPIGSSGSTREESLTDLNRDGVLDLILLGSSTLEVRFGTGRGGFGSGPSYPLATNGRDFHVDDWNRDGKPDVAVATQAGIVMFTGSASGVLTLSSTIEATRAFADVTSGDFNRDGWPDLAGRDEYFTGAAADAGGASIYLANAGGGFGPRTTLPAFDRLGSEIASWDVNRDGSPDIVAAGEADWIDVSFPSHATYATAAVWLGNGTGVFRHDSDYLVGLTPNGNRISFGDVNRDGQTDIFGRNEDWLTDTTSVSYVSFLRGAMPAFTGQLAGHTEYAASAGPSSLAIADFNRDGRPDAAAIGGTGVDILLGNGSGALTSAGPIDVGSLVVAGDAADLDRDGDQDVVAIANNGNCSLLINDGQGQFSSIPISVGSDVTDLAMGDLNRDGIPDLVVCDTASGSIVVKQGTGVPGFSDPVEYFPSNGGVHVALGDLNRDGWLDVVVDDPWLGNVAIFLNDGRGGLLESAYVTIGSGSRDILLVDLNRDGRLDIVAPRSSEGPRLTVLLANGMGGFNSPLNNVLLVDPRGVGVGDVNADGIVDLLVANNLGLEVFRGNGAGGFSYYDPYEMGIDVSSAAQADLDRDGRPDVITANGGALTVSVLLGSDATPTGVAVEPAPPARPSLAQNRPNPFNPRTEIRFSLPASGPARLVVFDAAGRVVATLAAGSMGAGEHRVFWDGRTASGASAASGVYFYRLEAKGFRDSRRMVLLR